MLRRILFCAYLLLLGTTAWAGNAQNCASMFANIEELALNDQALRARVNMSNIDASLEKSIKLQDRRNSAELERVLVECGWPEPLLGSTSHAAWIIVQHADHNVGLQQRVLELLAPQAHGGAFDRGAFAKLTDRVAINTGKKQLYGTQLTVADGRVWLPAEEIDSLEAVDGRRAALGLEPFEVYLDRAKKKVLENSAASKQ